MRYPALWQAIDGDNLKFGDEIEYMVSCTPLADVIRCLIAIVCQVIKMDHANRTPLLSLRGALITVHFRGQ